MTFDVTVFEDDDETPFFGTGDGVGGVTEADFSTDPGHPRPFLGDVRNWSASEIDFTAGSSTLGGLTLEVLDKRLDPADQATGVLTSRLGDIVGKRLLLRRLHPTLGMVTAFNGVVQSYELDKSLVKIALQVRDIRERERRQPLFLSNHVIYGKGGAEGPAINYGALPGGGHLLEEIAGEPSIVAGGISHFQRLDLGIPTDGIFYGLLAALPQVDPFNLGDLGWPAAGTDGLFYYRKFQVQWRALGSSDPWVTLREMPRAVYQNAATREHNEILQPRGADSLFFNASTLYLGSFDEYDVPANGQEIEYRVLAADISVDTPFWWDGGSFGDLLKEIYDGEHTLDANAPRVQYNPTDMAAFRAATPPARFVLREPVDDMREWVEKNIYAPLGYAPAFDALKRVSPVAWALPDNATEVPIVTADNLVPVGGWQHGAGNVVNTVEFTYIREHLDPLKTIVKNKTKRFLGFLWKQDTDETFTEPDPSDNRVPWQRLVEVQVHDDGVNPVSVLTFSAKKITYEPVTVRAIAGGDGLPPGGDTQDDLGAQLARAIRQALLTRFPFGAPVFECEVLASDPGVQDLREGSWVRLRGPWLPSYDTAERYVREYFQVSAISDEDPSRRALTLVGSRVPDLTADDDAEGTAVAGTDCLAASGGNAFPAASGKTVRILVEDGFITNSCDTPVEVDLIVVGAGGSGGGGAGGAGGGGGAGGVLGVGTPITITVPANSSVPVTVGAGGSGGASGGDTTVWMDRVTGAILDPDVDDPADAYTAVGGGSGSTSSAGNNGGSGGGGGGLSTSGGHSYPGGSGTTGQGNAGGSGGDAGGPATCQTSAGGGGGSFGGAGQDAAISFTEEPSQPGSGGPGTFVQDGWGVMLGGGGGGALYEVPGALGPLCNSNALPGSSGDGGLGFGGGGGAGAGGDPGGDGGVAIRYSGARLKLVPPEISSSTTTDQNQQRICVEGGDWPPGAVDGITVRVEYALGDTEPAADSGDWRFVDRLTAPGCVTTPPVPTGAKVWSRAFAEAPDYLPSPAGDAVSTTTPATPGLLAHLLTIEDGVGLVTWTPNTSCGAVRVRWLVHDLDDSTARPLASSEDLDASVGEFTIPDTVPRGSYLTVDIECWADDYYDDQGRTYRLSAQNVAPLVATSGESIDFFSDVELSDPADDALQGEILVRDGYGIFRNRVWPRLDEWAEPEDNTDLDANTSRHGLMPKFPGGTGTFLRADGSFAAITQDWTEVIAVSDQDVTNNGTSQNDAELSVALAANALYRVQLLLLYAGSDATVDFLGEFAFPSSDLSFWGWGVTAGDGAYFFAPARNGPTATDLGSSFNLGTLASYGPRLFEFNMQIATNSAGTLQFKFANVNPAGGRTSRRLAGSILRYRRLL